MDTVAGNTSGRRQQAERPEDWSHHLTLTAPHRQETTDDWQMCRGVNDGSEKGSIGVEVTALNRYRA